VEHFFSEVAGACHGSSSILIYKTEEAAPGKAQDVDQVWQVKVQLEYIYIYIYKHTCVFKETYTPTHIYISEAQDVDQLWQVKVNMYIYVYIYIHSRHPTLCPVYTYIHIYIHKYIYV